MERKNTVFYKCEKSGNKIRLIEGDINHIRC